MELRHTRHIHPEVSHCIARTQAQRLSNVSLCFLGATDTNLAKSDKVMGVSEISIQRQSMLTFGYALCPTLGANLDKSQIHMGARMVRDQCQGLGQFRLRPGEGRRGIGHNEIRAFDHVRARQFDERVDISGIGNERAIEKTMRSRDIVRGLTLVDPSETLKIEVHRVGVRRLFRASSLRGCNLSVERIRQTRDDFVLHVEEIGEGFIEPLSPEMTARFGVDELHVDPHAVAAALNAALEHVADVQFAPNRLHVERLSFVKERRIASDHDGAS